MKRVNFVTLGVKNLAASKAFFGELFGWKPVQKDNEHIVFFDMGGWILSLFPRDHLASDITLSSAEGGGFPGITLAHNVAEKSEVAPFLARAERLGAKIKKPAQDVFWGGHSGYFQDIDGHFWEVAWNPHMPLKADGTLETSPES